MTDIDYSSGYGMHSDPRILVVHSFFPLQSYVILDKFQSQHEILTVEALKFGCRTISRCIAWMSCRSTIMHSIYLMLSALSLHWG